MDADRTRRPGPHFRLNPLVLAGLASFLVGSAWLLTTLGFGGPSGTPVLDRALGSAIRLAQGGILWGDIQLDEAQIRFNALVVGVFLDGLSPAQRATVSAVSDAVAAFGRDVCSPLGLTTMVALIAAYVAIRRALDLNFPDLQ